MLFFFITWIRVIEQSLLYDSAWMETSSNSSLVRNGPARIPDSTGLYVNWTEEEEARISETLLAIR